MEGKAMNRKYTTRTFALLDKPEYFIIALGPKS